MPQDSHRHPRRRSPTRALAAVTLAAACLVIPSTALAAPDTTITARPTVAANDDYARFDFESTNPSATFECQRDGSAWAACSSPKTYTGLTDGNHTFNVRAKDGTGTDATPATFTWPVEPLNGIGMGVPFVNRGKYIWANDFGTDSQRQLLGDVTGDGRDDAVAFYRYVSGGKWLVSRSNPRDATTDSPGNGFVLVTAAPLTGLGGNGLLNAMLGDVDGDGDEDIVAIDLTTNHWYVAKSRWRNGSTGFDAPTVWAAGYGAGSTDQFLADVSGDGKADAVVYSGGTWTVRASNGSGFLFPGNWRTGFGSGSSARFLGDATGDGTADAIVFNSSNGNWDVAPSCGELNAPNNACSSGIPTSFGTSSTWVQAFGNDPTYPSTPLVGDVGGGPGGFSGDGRVDAVIYHGADPGDPPNDEPRFVWERATSTGTSFAKSAVTWKSGHRIHGSVGKLMLGNADGHMRDSTGTYDATDDPVIFENDAGLGLVGRWKFIPGEGKALDPEGIYAGSSPNRTLVDEKYRPSSPGKWNHWEADWAGPHPTKSLDVNGWRPVAPAGSAYTAYPKNQYDAFDSDVIDYQLREIRDADIDYVSLDESNDLSTAGGFLWNRAQKVCQRIAALRPAEPRIPRLTVLIGSFGDGTPGQVQAQAQTTYEDLATNSQCGEIDSRGLARGYMQLQGKPVVVLYLEKPAKDAFLSATTPLVNGETPYEWVSNRFTIRWHQGAVEWHPPANKPDAYPGADFWKYFGMVWWDGSIPSSLGMGVMPGWKRQYDDSRYVARHVPEVDKEFYDWCAWRRVYSQSPRPDVVEIEGYNGYGERTAVASSVAPADAGWYNNATEPDWYWRRTAHWTALRKAHDTGSYTPPTTTGCEN
jgi:hypothetical protein